MGSPTAENALHAPAADNLPRVHELADHSIALASPAAYFQAGDDKLTAPAKRPFFVAIERELQGLDAAAWEALKAEALPCLATPSEGRGWEQLFSILNQARGFNYLKKLGCTDIRFVARDKGKTPDLEATLGTRVLCEVKTIQISAAEVARRQCRGVGRTLANITPELLTKLRRCVGEARGQMTTFDAAARPIAYIVINFDDLLHEYAPEYEAQIRAALAATPAGVEVVLDIKPPFHAAVLAAP